MNYYTYAYLREDRTPYYIGKGKGRRIYSNTGRPCKKPKDKLRIIFLKQNLTEEEAFKHEIYMISVFGRKDLGTGILRNKTNGGEGCSGYKYTEEMRKKCRGETANFYGKTHSKETREKMSSATKGENNHFYGKTHSPETRAKISAANKGENNYWYGKTLSPETKAKLSAAQKGENNYFYGKKRPEHSEKMSGKNNPNYCKGNYYEFMSPQGEVGYTCLLENFCKVNNLDRGAIGKVINYQARHHKGWTVFKLD